jgi:hypothetical protein
VQFPDYLPAVKRMISEPACNPDVAPGLTADTWSYQRVWMEGPVKDTGITGLCVRTWTQKYLTALSLGPWQISKQATQKNALLSRVGDAEWSTLTPELVASLPFTLTWQRSLAVALHANLRGLAWTIDFLCDRIAHVSGAGAYAVLATLSDVKGYSKCLDFFVREGLRLDTVPVDTHVHDFLKRFGLEHIPSDQLTCLIREAGFEPRFVARAMYEQGLKK